MDFIIKMKEAMGLLAKACNMNNDWTDCQYCPFISYCDLFEESGHEVPGEEFLEYTDK